jgi:hypothetical protein
VAEPRNIKNLKYVYQRPIHCKCNTKNDLSLQYLAISLSYYGLKISSFGRKLAKSQDPKMFSHGEGGGGDTIKH